MLERRPIAACLVPVLCTALLLAAAGCRIFNDDAGLFVDPRDDYVSATVSQPLRLPDGMEANVGDTWPIPDAVEQPTSRTYVDEVPRPRFLAGANLDAIKIQRLGDKSWIVMADAPEQVWPLVRQLVEDSGVGLAREDPPAGIVETAWFTADASAMDVLQKAVGAGLADHEAAPGTTFLERVQIRIERGIRLGSTEVHVVHYRTSDENEGTVETSAVPAVEAELITDIAGYFAQGVAAQSVSMIGREIASVGKARIVEDSSGVPTLLLSIGFDRAWATVDGALQRSTMELTEADRDGAIFRAMVPPERRPGFFARIIPGGNADQGTAVTIRLRETDDGVVVEVRDGRDGSVSRELAERVLLTLREFAA